MCQLSFYFILLEKEGIRYSPTVVMCKDLVDNEDDLVRKGPPLFSEINYYILE